MCACCPLFVGSCSCFCLLFSDSARAYRSSITKPLSSTLRFLSCLKLALWLLLLTSSMCALLLLLPLLSVSFEPLIVEALSLFNLVDRRRCAWFSQRRCYILSTDGRDTMYVGAGEISVRIWLRCKEIQSIPSTRSFRYNTYTYIIWRWWRYLSVYVVGVTVRLHTARIHLESWMRACIDLLLQ